MTRRLPRSTLFPTRRSSDLHEELDRDQIDDGGVNGGEQEQSEGDADRETKSVAERAADECFAHVRSEEHTSELQSRRDLVCRLLLEKKKKKNKQHTL